MKAKITLFNSGVSRSLLKRCWPLWTSYFAALVLFLPVSLSSRLRAYESSSELADLLIGCIFNNGAELALLSFFACIIAAMLMYGYMYDAKSCGMMNALPIRRETIFSTAFITGLAPLILSDIVVFIITTALFKSYTGMGALLTWLLMAVLCNLAFFGIATFCAVLTGSIIILPALYIVLNFTAYLAESAVDALLRIFLYGYTLSDYTFSLASPVYGLTSNLHSYFTGLPEDPGRHMDGMGLLGIYAAAGLALAVAALFIYRKRRMETVSDTVAIPILKPIFKYCMCFGSSIVFAAVIYHWFFDNMLSGFADFVLVLSLLLLGAFIGYFVAEMLMQKTVRVFSGAWKGFLSSGCVIIVLTLGLELDIFGYEDYVPAPEQVQSVRLNYDTGTVYKNAENIQLITELHQSIIDDKAINESSNNSYGVSFSYTLQDGRTLGRRYSLSLDAQQLESDSSDIALLENLLNVQEAILQRNSLSIPVTVKNMGYCAAYYSYYDENGEYKSRSIELTGSEAELLYKQCLLPDINDGTLGLQYIYRSAAYYANSSNAYINFELRTMGDSGLTVYDYLSFDVSLSAKRTCAWMEEQCGEAFMSAGEAEMYSEAASEKYDVAMG